MFRDLIVHYYGQGGYEGVVILLKLYPIWLTLILGILFWSVWVRYVHYLFFFGTKSVLLEIRLPRDIFKTPLAMELVLNSMYQTGGESGFIAKYWEGKTRPWFSLEIVSEGGQIRFLIWTRENLRNLIESQIYSQYPGIEIHQVDDYATKLKFEPGKNDLWGCHFELSQPDPLPIKTYADYGLDKAQKEEEKVDPLSSILEYMSSMKAGENIYMQIVVRAHKKEKRHGFFVKADDWTSKITSLRKAFIARAKEEDRSRPSREEEKVYEALNRRSQKYPFDCGIRILYYADTKDVYNAAVIGALSGLYKPFSVAFPDDPSKANSRYYAGWNSFKPEKATNIDFPRMDFLGRGLNSMKKSMLDSYKRRMFFYEPYKMKSIILTTEELATIYHFPGSTAAAPGLSRIPSKRGQAPTNLPT
jgi:hypothetical protein